MVDKFITSAIRIAASAAGGHQELKVHLGQWAVECLILLHCSWFNCRSYTCRWLLIGLQGLEENIFGLLKVLLKHKQA